MELMPRTLADWREVCHQLCVGRRVKARGDLLRRVRGGATSFNPLLPPRRTTRWDAAAPGCATGKCSANSRPTSPTASDNRLRVTAFLEQRAAWSCRRADFQNSSSPHLPWMPVVADHGVFVRLGGEVDEHAVARGGLFHAQLGESVRARRAGRPSTSCDGKPMDADLPAGGAFGRGDGRRDAPRGRAPGEKCLAFMGTGKNKKHRASHQLLPAPPPPVSPPPEENPPLSRHPHRRQIRHRPQNHRPPLKTPAAAEQTAENTPDHRPLRR